MPARSDGDASGAGVFVVPVFGGPMRGGVGIVAVIGRTAGRTAMSSGWTVVVVPSMEAIAAPPAETPAVGVAAPVETGTLPAGVVPAVAVSPKGELHAFQRHHVTRLIDTEYQLRRRFGACCADGKGRTRQGRRRGEAQDETAHGDSFIAVSMYFQKNIFAVSGDH
jgi:hypothetical protein